MIECFVAAATARGGSGSVPPKCDWITNDLLVGWQSVRLFRLQCVCTTRLAFSLQTCRKGWLFLGLTRRHTCRDEKKEATDTRDLSALSATLPRFISRVRLKHTNQPVALKSDLVSTSVNLCLVCAPPLPAERAHIALKLAPAIKFRDSAAYLSSSFAQFAIKKVTRRI